MIHITSSSDAFFITCSLSEIIVSYPTGHNQTIQCWFRVSSLALSPNDEFLCINEHATGHIFNLKQWKWVRINAYSEKRQGLGWMSSPVSLFHWNSKWIFWFTRIQGGSVMMITTLDGQQVSRHSFIESWIQGACLYHDQQHLLLYLDQEWNLYHLEYRVCRGYPRKMWPESELVACVEREDHLYVVCDFMGYSNVLELHRDTAPTTLFSHIHCVDLNLVFCSDGFHLKTPLVVLALCSALEMKKNLLQCYDDVFGSRELYAVLLMIIDYLRIPLDYRDQRMMESSPLDEDEIWTVMTQASVPRRTAISSLERHGNIVDAILELTP
jgi:hypothetical protein